MTKPASAVIGVVTQTTVAIGSPTAEISRETVVVAMADSIRARLPRSPS